MPIPFHFRFKIKKPLENQRHLDGERIELPTCSNWKSVKKNAIAFFRILLLSARHDLSCRLQNVGIDQVIMPIPFHFRFKIKKPLENQRHLDGERIELPTCSNWKSVKKNAIAFFRILLLSARHDLSCRLQNVGIGQVIIAIPLSFSL